MDPPPRRPFLGLFARSEGYQPPREDSTANDTSSLSISHRDKGRLGLTTLYEPAQTAVDIIFIHGLGGGSRKTWSFSKDPYHYWPESWLPSDPDFQDARIHVFGYNADWAEWQQSILGIHDFAQSLLVELKNHPSIRRDASSIVLVGHSMGGCVAKKAYILAREDPSCKRLVERVHSLFFLGTPHRGSDLAPVLKNILMLAWGRKPFLHDLIPNSTALNEINDAFRQYASDLCLWSFYETRPVKLRIVVDKLSSTLGYPNEEIAAMNADHRHVCKFDTPHDPNYRLFRNALHTAIDRIRASTTVEAARASKYTSANPEMGNLSSSSINARIASFLGINDPLEDDYATLRDLKEPGSCEWLTSRADYMSWVQGTGPQILWLTGRPGAGKSVLSCHLIDCLGNFQPGESCSYFFFKYGKNGKSTLSDCLLSLTYQMAINDEFIRDHLVALQEGSGDAWDKSDARSVWRRLFLGIIFKSPLLSRHTWVIDGVDECANFDMLFTKTFLAAVPKHIRIFATSRSLEKIQRGLASLGQGAKAYALTEDDTLDDIRLFIGAKFTELDRLESHEDRETMCSTILEKSQGSFLWVRLVLRDFENAWTKEAMDDVLRVVPSDLHDVYCRILQSIEADNGKKRFAKSILTWVVLGSRPLSVDELRSAVKFDTGQTLQSAAKAIPDLCEQLVLVDQANKVHIIHETARTFLIEEDLDSELKVQKTQAHTHLACLLLRYLSGDALKYQPPKTTVGEARSLIRSLAFSSIKSSTSVTAGPDREMLSYAVYFFSDHICQGIPEDCCLLEELCTFLTCQNVLSWIEHIAQEGNIGPITRTALSLQGCLSQKLEVDLPTNSAVRLVNEWVVDLIRVAAKFTSQLLTCPSSIYCLIPPLCPPESAISKRFSEEPRLSPLAVRNLAAGTWDDCLTRIDFSKSPITSIAHGSGLFAVALSIGRISLYDSASIQPVRDIHHPERIRLMAFSESDSLMVSCGNKHMVVWQVESGSCLMSLPLKSPPLCVTYLGDGTELLMASQDSRLTKWDFEDGSCESLSLLDQEGFDSVYPQDMPNQSPTRAAFSENLPGHGFLLAMGYRNYPVTIWSALELRLLGKCGGNSSINGVDDIIFNPNPDIAALVVSYTLGDLCIYDYNTMELDSAVPKTYANCLSCSRDGRNLVSGSSQGVVQVFQFDKEPSDNTVLTSIYRVQAFDDGIRGIAFRFDGLRIVDVNRRQCQVWEPIALVGKENNVKNTGNSVATETTVQWQDSPGKHLLDITCPLAVSEVAGIVVAGRRNGQVVAFSLCDGLELGVVYCHAKGASVISVTVAESGKIVASADDSGRVVVTNISYESYSAATNGPVATPQSSQTPCLPGTVGFDHLLGAAVSQLLINSEENRLQVSGLGVVELWELPSGELIGPHEPDMRKSTSSSMTEDTACFTAADPPSTFMIAHSALPHPDDRSRFVIVVGDIVHVIAWADFTQDASLNASTMRKQHEGYEVADMTGVIPLYNSLPGIGVIEHVVPSPSKPGHLLLWPVGALDAPDHSTNHAPEPPGDWNLEAIGPTVQSILGVVGGSRLVFLDINLWVCSLDLRLSAAGHPAKRSDGLSIPGSETSRSQSPGALSLRTKSVSSSSQDIRLGGHVQRHFFAMSEWRDGNGRVRCTMVPSPAAASSRNSGPSFVFADGHRVLVVHGGLEFSETVVLRPPGGKDSGTGKGNIFEDSALSPTKSSGGQHWSVVSGSMYRRTLHW